MNLIMNVMLGDTNAFVLNRLTHFAISHVLDFKVQILDFCILYSFVMSVTGWLSTVCNVTCDRQF